MDEITFRQDGITKTKTGRIFIDASNALVFEAQDSQYYIVKAEDQISRKENDVPFSYLTKRELLKNLEETFPHSRGFDILQKEHFFIVYTTSKAFADWYGRLLEQLYSSYIAFWRSRGLKLDKLETTMTALIFANSEQFFQFAATEGVQRNEQMFAYYNKLTNRIVLRDFSGYETFRSGSDYRATSKDIEQFLQQPGAVFNIAMVVHEATHQIGYNCGMHERFSPYPLWLIEGLALFHEVPDRGKKGGWNIRPKVNDMRLRDLKRYLAKQPPRPLQTLIEDDKVLQDSATALDNYGMAWGLTYYLIMTRQKELAAYMKKLSEKTPLTKDSPEIRIKEFEESFGNDWQKIYNDCGDYLRKL
ncbi:hypothetical protein FACS189427_10240 [Planctomycetales bacterium]|nr:hypothetical protein FACS189427_10240 [Planctomycetales bacterium]